MKDKEQNMNWEKLRQEIEKLLWQEYKEPQEEGMSLNMEELSEKIIEHMNHELAKQLKDAGFPQGEMPYYDSEGFIHRTAEEERAWVYTPTLEELIEACGATYIQEYDIFDFSLEYFDGFWYANFTNANDQPCDLENGIGSTPTEAVANLWLALKNLPPQPPLNR